MEKIVMTITFDPQTRQTQVNGPIKDKMTSYAMLEAARDAIHEFHMKGADQSTIVPARFDRLNLNGG